MQHKKVNFPVTLVGHWQSPNDENLEVLTNTLKDWLLDEGSLTARLKSRSDNFSVRVIGEKQMLCTAEEACRAIKVGEPVLVREVILYCDNIPHVFARSLLPLTSLTGDEQVLANLGEQPLGQVLFNNPSLKRHRLEVASFTVGSSVVNLAEVLTENSLLNSLFNKDQVLWGRRSIFMLENKPLMVAEVFLPDAYAYQE